MRTLASYSQSEQSELSLWKVERPTEQERDQEAFGMLLLDPVSTLCRACWKANEVVAPSSITLQLPTPRYNLW